MQVVREQLLTLDAVTRSTSSYQMSTLAKAVQALAPRVDEGSLDRCEKAVRMLLARRNDAPSSVASVSALLAVAGRRDDRTFVGPVFEGLTPPLTGPAIALSGSRKSRMRRSIDGSEFN